MGGWVCVYVWWVGVVGWVGVYMRACVHMFMCIRFYCGDTDRPLIKSLCQLCICAPPLVTPVEDLGTCVAEPIRRWYVCVCQLINCACLLFPISSPSIVVCLLRLLSQSLSIVTVKSSSLETTLVLWIQPWFFGFIHGSLDSTVVLCIIRVFFLRSGSLDTTVVLWIQT